MNWKNVLRLISVDTKSGRLIRGQRLRRYTESKLFPYLLYGGSCILGLAIGWLVGNFYSGIPDLDTKAIIYQGALNLFPSLPTMVLIYSLVFTMMSQIQRSGARASIQPPYWLPITWEEHTLASTLANLIGVPLASIVLIGSAVAVASIFLGTIALATLTIFALLVSAFLASTTTEIFRILQVRLVGAVYKSSGRAAIWVRFLGTMLFLIAFYIVWFAFTSGANYVAIVEGIASAQSTLWLIPYVWLGIALVFFIKGLLAYVVIFSLASLLFILVLFYVAIRMNMRFGLYEPPAITVSRGAYAPRVGFLGKLGFSSLEAAVMKKDFKAFTRRRELMYLFIMPLVFIIMPLMQWVGQGERFSPFIFAWILLGPGTIMAVMLGSMIVGSEGGSIWHFYSSPITARGFVKCKYAFVTIFSLIVMGVCSVVAVLVAHPSLDLAIASSIESVLLIVALGMVSLRSGIKGADFVEIPRPRMIRPLSAVVNMIVCAVLALVILSPLIPYAISMMISLMNLPISLPKFDLHLALPISGFVSLIITYIFYKMTLKNAEDFLTKAEV